MELGGVPNLMTDDMVDINDKPVTLELTNRFANVKGMAFSLPHKLARLIASPSDPLAEEKALWIQAKRGVLAILRVQPAKDLVESLMQPVSEEHEMFWEDIVDRELLNDHMRQRQRRLPSTTGQDSAYRLEDVRSYVSVSRIFSSEVVTIESIG
jgi:Ras GTPase-activating-like protein IQGAP2/3